MKAPPKNSHTLAEQVRHLGLLFARKEQPLLAGMVLVSLIGIGFWCWRHSVRTNQIIDIDQRTHQTVSFQIDLNSATWSELSNLPGIGEQRAKDIVAYREQIGSFSSLESIQNVAGIGPRTFEQITPFLAPLSPSRSELTVVPPAASTR